MSDPRIPEEILAPITHINCPGCRVRFSHPIHERTLMQDESVLVCRSDGCRNKDKLWDTPCALLTEHKKS